MGSRARVVVAPVVAAADAPRLRRDLVVRRIPEQEESSYVVKDPVARKYFRFPEAAGRLLAYLDGQTSLTDLQQRLRTEGASVPSAAALEGLVQRLRALDLLELSPAERMERQLEQFRSERRLRVRSRNAHGSLLHYRFSLWDPDRWMDRVIPRLGFFWTPTFVVLSVAAVLVATAMIAVHWRLFANELLELFSGRAGLPKYGLLILISLGIIAIHELGHGLTCKRFGGHVHEIGFLLLYFMPCFYCNVTDAWLFERRRERLWVTLAGAQIELFVGALATFAWWFTEPGHPVNVIAFQTALVASVSTVVVNLNPLMKLDGYYALIDYLGVPNLRESSFQYLGTLARRHLLRSPAATPELSERRRRILLSYGLIAGVYSVTVLVLLAHWTFDFLVRNGGDWGVLGFVALATALFGLPVSRKAAMLRHSVFGLRSSVFGLRARSQHRTPNTEHRIPKVSWLLPAGLLIALGSIPRWSMPVRLYCVFEPSREAVLYAPEDAQVAQVLCAEGEPVEAGQLLLMLRAAELSAERARARLDLALLQLNAREAQRAGDLAAWRGARRRVQAQQKELKRLERRATWLTVSSPLEGTCLTPRPKALLGRAVTRGAPLVTVGDVSRLTAVVHVDPRHSWGLQEGVSVLVRPHSLPGTTLRGRALALTPLEGSPLSAGSSGAGGPAPVSHSTLNGEPSTGFRLAVPVANPGGLRPGMTGSVKVYGPARSLLGHLREAALRLIRADLWG